MASNPPDDDPRIILGMKLTNACKYMYASQGLTIEDLIFMLHGIMGQVLSWDTPDEDQPSVPDSNLPFDSDDKDDD